MSQEAKDGLDEILGDFIFRWHQIENHAEDASSYDETKQQIKDLILEALPSKMPEMHETADKLLYRTGYNDALDKVSNVITAYFTNKRGDSDE